VRDDFDQKTKDVLSKRAGGKCSNPECRRVTSAPHTNHEKAMNIGVAAHITAASVGGPRYDSKLSKEERMSANNGIWLCQFCGTLVDSDAVRYPIDLLRHWKSMAESLALFEVENRSGAKQTSNFGVFWKLENRMSVLLNEMRQDLLQYPLKREFVLLKRSWTYWAAGHELCYYYDDHDDLEGMVNILCNYNLVRDVTFNNVKRYIFLEELVDYLSQDRTEV